MSMIIEDDSEATPSPPTDARLLRVLATMLKEGNLVEREGKLFLEIVAANGQDIMSLGLVQTTIKAIISELESIADWIVADAEAEAEKRRSQREADRDRWDRCYEFFCEQMEKAVAESPNSERTLDLVATYLKVMR